MFQYEVTTKLHASFAIHMSLCKYILTAFSFIFVNCAGGGGSQVGGSSILLGNGLGSEGGVA